MAPLRRSARVSADSSAAGSGPASSTALEQRELPPQQNVVAIPADQAQGLASDKQTHADSESGASQRQEQDEACSRCGEEDVARRGVMLLCDACPRAWHVACLEMGWDVHDVSQFPKHALWHCPTCSKQQGGEFLPDATAKVVASAASSRAVTTNRTKRRAEEHAAGQQETHPGQHLAQRSLRRRKASGSTDHESSGRHYPGRAQAVHDALASTHVSARNAATQAPGPADVSASLASAQSQPRIEDDPMRPVEPASRAEEDDEALARRPGASPNTALRVALARAGAFARGEGFLDDAGGNAAADALGGGDSGEESSDSSSSNSSRGFGEHGRDEGGSSESDVEGRAERTMRGIRAHLDHVESWPGPYATAHAYAIQRARLRGDSGAQSSTDLATEGKDARGTYKMTKRRLEFPSLRDLAMHTIVDELRKLRDSFIQREKAAQVEEEQRVLALSVRKAVPKGAAADPDARREPQMIEVDPDDLWQGPLQELAVVFPHELERLAQRLACERRLDRVLVRLFSAPDARVLQIPDCSGLSEQQLRDAVARVVGESDVQTGVDSNNERHHETGREPCKLETVHLWFCGRCLGPRTLALLGKATRITSLALGGAFAIRSEALLSCVRKLPLLNSLRLSAASKLFAPFMQELSGLEHLRCNLVELHLDDMPDLLDAAAVRCIGAFTNLRSLSLQGLNFVIKPTNEEAKTNPHTRLNTELISALAYALSQLPRLERLDLSQPYLPLSKKLDRKGSGRICRIIGRHARMLTHLKLTHFAGMRDKHLIKLSRSCARLQQLSLRQNRYLTDAGLQHILMDVSSVGSSTIERRAGAPTRTGCRLEYLDVSGLAFLTDDFMRVLCGAALDSLKYVDISFCRKLSPEVLLTLVNKGASMRELCVRGCSQLTDDNFVQHIVNPFIGLVSYGMESKMALNPTTLKMRL
ncbi:F-box/LRR-repeat protein 13 [Porphyridium purpureum]|uniref:F-box/LRR-repeat protein 13 n=1 Tax=Porphyridium purpureum TaxID=35688 RepID=A0A5J4YJK5_PORPP|nr:F-box/LRR-repeat protein 13 [Porphyridium purpureum]|eukprot:POR7972..scf289_17